MDYSIIINISNYIGYPIEICLEFSEKAPKTYRKYLIPKKNGGSRIIHHPSKHTKSLQYALIETFLINFPLHRCAFAYRRNWKTPLLQNAEKHKNYKYSIKIDFENFFNSISCDDLFPVVKKKYPDISNDDLKFLEKCLFIKLKTGKMGLAVGAPSSPLISNIVMFDFDTDILKIAFSINENSVYTRYADDIVFSSNTKGDCSKFYSELSTYINSITNPKLKINKDKTVFSSKGKRRVITGIFITPEGKTSLGRKNKRYIRKLLFDFKNNNITDDESKYLSGYLAYILDVEPDFYNRLTIKYGAETLKKAQYFLYNQSDI